MSFWFRPLGPLSAVKVAAFDALSAAARHDHRDIMK